MCASLGAKTALCCCMCYTSLISSSSSTGSCCSLLLMKVFEDIEILRYRQCSSKQLNINCLLKYSLTLNSIKAGTWIEYTQL